MNITEILSLDSEKWLTELVTDVRDVQKNIDYYNGKHPILTDLNRQDYNVPKYKVNAAGDIVNDANGNPIEEGYTTIQRKRIVLDYQKQIVETAVGMTVGNPVTLTLNSGDEDTFNEFVNQWQNKARLDTFNLKLAERLFVESKVAEVFYFEDTESGEPNQEKELKVSMWCKENGNDIYPHFDDDGKLDAVTRKFTKRIVKQGSATDVSVVQIWTADNKFEKIANENWTDVANPYKKIPIVYYDQKKSEFEIVKELIGVIELVRSQSSDVNKRIGNPNVVVNGQIVGKPDIEQDVKVWNTQSIPDGNGGLIESSVSYLQMTGAPEAIKMELEQHTQDMYKLTWPDLSFLLTAIKTGNLSGTAIQLMFTSAFVKVALKRAIFEDFSRRISVMKRMLATATNNQAFNDLNISVTFNSILPVNDQEIADTLATAVHGGFTSKQQAAKKFTYNRGAQNIYEEIQIEEAAANGSAG